MVRRIASQVHKQAARLLRKGYIEKEPAWYQAVLEYPPIPLPARAAAERLSDDGDTAARKTTVPLSSAKRRGAERTVLPVVYLEDEIRRQFFRDHPFEAYRERTLVESGTIEPEHPIHGQAWTRLSQRGRNPIAEDAIRYAVNLHEHFKMPLSQAYSQAVTQFRSLRSEHEMATFAATAEAEHYGAQFGPTEIEKNHEREQRFIDTWDSKKASSRGSSETDKRWRANVPRGKKPVFTGGQEYVQLWKKGVRPSFARVLTAPRITAASPVQPSITHDFMTSQNLATVSRAGS